VPIENWTVMDTQTEPKDQFVENRVFQAFGGPFRYLRIVTDAVNSDGRRHLVFKHIEFFGALYPAAS
jgi:hypothetical protein